MPFKRCHAAARDGDLDLLKQLDEQKQDVIGVRTLGECHSLPQEPARTSTLSVGVISGGWTSLHYAA